VRGADARSSTVLHGPIAALEALRQPKIRVAARLKAALVQSKIKVKGVGQESPTHTGFRRELV
jgi:hypothetical protein